MREKKDYSKTLIIKADMEGLQYDINGILKAFYPEMDIRVFTVDSDGQVMDAVHDEDILNEPTCMDISISSQRLTIHYLPDNMNETCEKTNEITVFPQVFDYVCDEKLGSKNSFKRFLYDTVSDLTGRTLPWGNLTGVRPSKIAMTMMKEGYPDDEIISFLKDIHRVSDSKINLALEVAHREDKLLKQIDTENGYSLYIGIPFCPTTCLYCSFTSYSISAWQKRVDDYIDALGKEIEYVVNECAQGKIPDTIYIGGGTPTSLDEEHLELLLKKITDEIDVSKSLEFTCEAGRPDSITPEKLRIMKKYGVTRISVNPQTMQQKTLDIIGRRVKVSQVIDCFGAAREAGFDNINMDIILGLPGEDDKDVADTLLQIEKLHPDSLTVHSLAIKRASALKRHLDEIGIEALKNTDETIALTEKSARSMSMAPYYMYRQKNMAGNFENVGYAAEGKEGLYNILIMEEVQSIIALGAGSVTKRVYPDGRIERCENIKDVALYIEKIDEMVERKRKLFEA